MKDKDIRTGPGVSIIIPVYNAEKTLERCVDSILSQDFKDLELLLIDDGSRDGSPDICDRYAERDSRVRVFHKENGGVSRARNLGLSEAGAGTYSSWTAMTGSRTMPPPSFFLLLKVRTAIWSSAIFTG